MRRYISLISPDVGVEFLINNEGVENFIALLLSECLIAEKAHHKAAHNNKVLERDGYKCQVPGCSNRRNIHAHHLEFRSHGGCDGNHNLLSLCVSHHLWILHILHGLSVRVNALCPTS
ncbi:MAG: HNH endonuclease [Candidatus Xenobiia bacterium LiM19]